MRTNYSDRVSGGTGWSLTAVTNGAGKPEPGGLIIKDVRHDGHNLARDIRMLRILLKVEVVDGFGNITGNEAYWLHLDDDWYFTATAVAEKRPTPSSLSGGLNVLPDASKALAFETYFQGDTGHIGYSLRVDYEGRPGMFWSILNFEFERMDASQIFLFSHHGTSPAHEPSGALPAARLHPLLDYKFAESSTYDTTIEHRRLASVRFDYRLHLQLDTTDTAVDLPPEVGNNAGLFRDADVPPFSAPMAVTGAEHLVFESVEKPVVLEVVAPGLAMGATVYGLTPGDPMSKGGKKFTVCWDNVHWWGSGVGPNIISSPGAFHAAHIHWRWGDLAPLARPFTPQPQFRPDAAPAAARRVFGNSGILVDPRIWIQTIRIAVTRYDSRLDPDRGVPLAELSHFDWQERFIGLRPRTPIDIFPRSHIVLWYSTEVHRSVTIPSIRAPGPRPPPGHGSSPRRTSYPGGTFAGRTEGTVFLHGLFFAHSAELTGGLVGSRTLQHWPRSLSEIRSAATWFRPA